MVEIAAKSGLIYHSEATNLQVPQTLQTLFIFYGVD